MLAPQTEGEPRSCTLLDRHAENKSIDEDEVDLCRKHAERLNCEVVAVYSDRARSGASLMGETVCSTSQRQPPG